MSLLQLCVSTIQSDHVIGLIGVSLLQFLSSAQASLSVCQYNQLASLVFCARSFSWIGAVLTAYSLQNLVHHRLHTYKHSDKHRQKRRRQQQAGKFGPSSTYDFFGFRRSSEVEYWSPRVTKCAKSTGGQWNIPPGTPGLESGLEDP